MRIVIHKFKRLENLTVNVPAELHGPNESGKTTILEAVSFVLTGKDLTGSEFKQIYDNRVDLHDAIADVSFFDDYQNEYRRTVTPTFHTNRAGVEEIKILRSTRCQKNSIDTNDFVSEFEMFQKFGTAWFFSEKEASQRAVFIDLMKSKMPDFDVVEAQTKLKMFQKSVTESQNEIKTLRNLMRALGTPSDLPGIPAELQDLEDEYQKSLKSISENQELIAEINQKNNALMQVFSAEKQRLISQIDFAKNSQIREKENLENLKTELSEIESTKFDGYVFTDVSELEEKLNQAENTLSQLQRFENLETFVNHFGYRSERVSTNVSRIKSLQNSTPENLPEGEEITNVCHCCGVASDAVFENGISNLIEKLKAENRVILQKKLNENNYIFDNAELNVTRLQAQLNSIKKENAEKKAREEDDLRAFQIRKTNRIEKINSEIKLIENNIFQNSEAEKSLIAELEALNEPFYYELPTESEVSEELKNAHQNFGEIQKKIIEISAINKNNEKIKSEKEDEIKANQLLLMNLDSEIIQLKNEISDYFSSLKGIVEQEFSGKIKIGVELQKYVIRNDEYVDDFKITANGKVFPYECNGALINNTKLQILSTLQRLAGYEGVTIIDNTEANTTQAIEPSGLKLIIARATEDKELKIIN